MAVLVEICKVCVCFSHDINRISFHHSNRTAQILMWGPKYFDKIMIRNFGLIEPIVFGKWFGLWGSWPSRFDFLAVSNAILYVNVCSDRWKLCSASVSCLNNNLLWAHTFESRAAGARRSTKCNLALVGIKWWSFFGQMSIHHTDLFALIKVSNRYVSKKNGKLWKQ